MSHRQQPAPVRIQRGDTDEQCVIENVPPKLDPETLSPLHPSIDFAVFVDGTHAGPRFSAQAQAERRYGFVPVSGLGPLATLLPGPYGGSYGIFAKVGESVIRFNAGPAKKPISQAQGIRLARAGDISPAVTAPRRLIRLGQLMPAPSGSIQLTRLGHRHRVCAALSSYRTTHDVTTVSPRLERRVEKSSVVTKETGVP